MRGRRPKYEGEPQVEIRPGLKIVKSKFDCIERHVLADGSLDKPISEIINDCEVATNEVVNLARAMVIAKRRVASDPEVE